MTTQAIKAIRATFKLGSIEMEGYQKPDGSYMLNQVQVTGVVNKDERSIRNFVASNSPEALPFKHLSTGKNTALILNKLKVVNDPKARSIAEVPLNLAIAYWTKETKVGNILAADLLQAC